MDLYEQRFSGIARLFGRPCLERLKRCHVAVVGIGGVGSWTVEALARCGVGQLTLIDLDSVCITNSNRQIHALSGQIGKEKARAMAERCRLINPEVEVTEVIEFFTAENAERLLKPDFDCVVDAIDSVAHKCALIAACREKGRRLVVSGGAGGKTDPTAVRRADLAVVTHDRLLKLVRKELRRSHGFPSESSREPFGIPAIHSLESSRYPWADGSVCESPEPGQALRLDCASGFGSATQVTGTFGFAAAAEVVKFCCA